MAIDYDHAANTHSASGPQAALPLLLGNQRPASLLDVGCGVGTWLLAARELGITDLVGVDGVEIPEASLLVSKKLFAHHDLSKPLRLGRRFDVLLCLEVAEHLEPEAGQVLITSLTEHGDTIFFSAASPGQPGQHHVNCQWPTYWQAIFNARGYVCDDAVRWEMWTDSRIERWYRQNTFCARKDASLAGHEPRIAAVIHPDFMLDYAQTEVSRNTLNHMTESSMPARLYLRNLFRSLLKTRKALR